ncbi:MAG: hypothetical protein ACXVMS_07820 [Flavisolibacter sp.]
MKKTVTILALALSIFACSRKTMNSAQTPAATPAATEAASAEAEHAGMVEKGQIVYTTRCNRCHALKDVAAFSATRWEGILKNMIPKAKLDTTQAQQVRAYVMEHARK